MACCIQLRADSLYCLKSNWKKSWTKSCSFFLPRGIYRNASPRSQPSQRALAVAIQSWFRTGLPCINCADCGSHRHLLGCLLHTAGSGSATGVAIATRRSTGPAHPPGELDKYGGCMINSLSKLPLLPLVVWILKILLQHFPDEKTHGIRKKEQKKN